MRFNPRHQSTNSPRRSLYQRITEITGPTRCTASRTIWPWLLIPEIGQHLCELGHARLSKPIFTSRHGNWDIGDCALLAINFEWYAHAPMAREAGITDTQIEHMKQGERPVSGRSANSLRRCPELVETRTLSSYV